MTKKLIDIDVETLEEAKRILGLGSYKETVNAGLHEIIATAARRHEIERFTSTDQHDVEDPGVIASAWR